MAFPATPLTLPSPSQPTPMAKAATLLRAQFTNKNVPLLSIELFGKKETYCRPISRRLALSRDEGVRQAGRGLVEGPPLRWRSMFLMCLRLWSPFGELAAGEGQPPADQLLQQVSFFPEKLDTEGNVLFCELRSKQRSGLGHRR